MGELGVCFKVVGDLSRFDLHIQGLIEKAQASTAQNTQITLTLAANYGGRQDVICAMQAWQIANPEKTAPQLTEQDLTEHLALAFAPDPDLIIRTGGEQRVSNFLLWQMAYSELYFTDVLWPNFSNNELGLAIEWFRSRERRFGGSGALLAAKA
jgi:undecaprenyl diphosphate synthase